MKVMSDPKLAWAAATARLLQDCQECFEEPWTFILSQINEVMNEGVKLTPAELAAVTAVTTLADTMFKARKE